MNTFFDSVFGKAIENFNESISELTLADDPLFSKIGKPIRFYRMPYLDGRRYFTAANGNPYLMSGLTRVTKTIKTHKGEDEYLTKWKVGMAEQGQDADMYAWEASEFGTLVHILAAELFSARARKEAISTSGLDKQLREYMNYIGINSFKFKEWYNNLCKSLLSLNEFYSRTEMEVLGVEYCVADFENNICTPLDIICEITTEIVQDVPTKTGGTKRAKQQSRDIWNLNIKARKKPERMSGDKYQICAEQYIANKYFKEFKLGVKIQRTGVISPSWNWISKPDCKLHEFTGYFPANHWNWYLHKMQEEPSRAYSEIFSPDLGQYIGDTNIFVITELGDVVNSKRQTIADYIMSKFE